MFKKRYAKIRFIYDDDEFAKRRYEKGNRVLVRKNCDENHYKYLEKHSVYYYTDIEKCLAIIVVKFTNWISRRFKLKSFMICKF